MHEGAPVDVPGDGLRTPRANGTVHFRDRLVASWAETFVGAGTASFHQVRREACRVAVGERAGRDHGDNATFGSLSRASATR